MANDAVAHLIERGRDAEAAKLGLERLEPQRRPMDPRTQLDRIIPMLDGLVAAIDESELDAATPCVKFSVRDVLTHMIGGATMFSAAFRGEAPKDPPSLPSDVRGGFPAAMAELLGSVHSEGALERSIVSPFGEMPGEMFARLVALDGLIHGWDIATATGQPYDPPADVVAAVDSFARKALTAELRDGDTFMTPTEPPPSSSSLEQLVAFTGRTVT